MDKKKKNEELVDLISNLLDNKSYA